MSQLRKDLFARAQPLTGYAASSSMRPGPLSEAEGGNIVDRRSMLILATMALLCLGASSYARADETLTFRATVHATSVQSQDVGDVDGHLMSIGRFLASGGKKREPLAW